ncbi:histidine kinase [Streptomyces sp. NE06-03E]|uniref:histidine kinase n=2 Tax=Streptomyces TaxID=1883 RepID=A0A652KXQ8_9ACTN|nr:MULTISPECIES: histidine kinase [unclassified Streptomyces]WSS64509.1 histidine kinase [Streptomyces sp. NBC_01177]WSS71502.1 histidine kinase [Streptomyces sp. NBC_01175]WSS78512.1 histidine kinase [Streptomyces sp. NBC_01174]MDX3056259.1 histidine kinase [Streptomyces sp. NE06-03E]MDX3327814.1 histidine kinase [Streptomyces sp. ME02-6979-3A]
MTSTTPETGPTLTGRVRRRVRRWTAAPPYPWLTGGALTVLAVVELAVVPGSVVTALGVLACTLSLMWRRAHPAVGFLTVGAALLSFGTDGNMAYATIAGTLMGSYTLGRHRVQHPALVVVCGALASLTVNLVHIDRWARDGSPGLPVLQGSDRFSLGLYAETLVLTVMILGAVSMGDAIRAREETRHERAAAQSRLLTMERRQAAEAERATIARELHDMIAHSVSMIAVQAESATYTTAELPGPARDAFQQIAGTARSSMAELRRLLGVLRAGTETAALRTPQPSLAGLEELLDQHRAVGGSADLRVLGERTVLPASWELSAYRIVQEALTNARRHAPGAHTVVEVDYRPGLLSVRVCDDGPGPSGTEPDGRSHGLVGMGERAALLGGRLTAGRGPAGGFLVEAELPW